MMLIRKDDLRNSPFSRPLGRRHRADFKVAASALGDREVLYCLRTFSFGDGNRRPTSGNLFLVTTPVQLSSLNDARHEDGDYHTEFDLYAMDRSIVYRVVSKRHLPDFVRPMSLKQVIPPSNVTVADILALPSARWIQPAQR